MFRFFQIIFKSRSVYLQERATVFIEQRVEKGPEPVWILLEKRKSLPSDRIPNPVHPAPRLVTTPIVLNRRQEYGLHVIIFVDLIDKVIHRKWEAGKTVDTYTA